VANEKALKIIFMRGAMGCEIKFGKKKSPSVVATEGLFIL
jgi:hypothetical protein